MSLRYCFEQDYVARTLSKSKPHDLAVIATDGISTAAIKAACTRDVSVRLYQCNLNIENVVYLLLFFQSISYKLKIEKRENYTNGLMYVEC